MAIVVLVLMVIELGYKLRIRVIVNVMPVRLQ